MMAKVYKTMFSGSMFGAGAVVFSVWVYALTHAQDGYVELNAKLLSGVIGAPEAECQAAIAWLAAPDPRSRRKNHEGCRLVRDGQFQYFIPNWMHYQTWRGPAACHPGMVTA